MFAFRISARRALFFGFAGLFFIQYFRIKSKWAVVEFDGMKYDFFFFFWSMNLDNRDCF